MLTGEGFRVACEHWKDLAHQGVLVHIWYARHPPFSFGWQLIIENAKTGERHRCVWGKSIAHCMETAEREARARGWL